jgi:hypothetical protein
MTGAAWSDHIVRMSWVLPRRNRGSEAVEGLESARPRREPVSQLLGAAAILIAVALLLIAAVWIVPA